MATLRAFCVLTIYLLVTAVCIPVQSVLVSTGLKWRKTFPRWYHRLTSRIIGIRINVVGAPFAGGSLMAANHTGWLDIPVLSAVLPVSFVAKSEVNRWPFFGTLARLQRTIFIHRGERAKAREDRDIIRQRLIDGDTLVIFPEGTSSDGNRVLRFKSALFSAAELPLGEDEHGRPTHAPVQPVSIALSGLHGMPMGREERPFFAWYGDMELVPHLWEAFHKGPIDVTVEFHAPLTIDAAGGRKQLAAAAESAIRAGVLRALQGGHSAPPPATDILPADALEEEFAGEEETV